MDESTTQRGFGIIKFKDTYGEHCSLQMSSLATLGHIWLGVDKHRDGTPAGQVVDGHHVGARMHLSRIQVAQLLPYLQNFVANGTLNVKADETPIVGLVREAVETALDEARESALESIADDLGLNNAESKDTTDA